MTKQQEKIIERVKKLLALSESPNENEATAAAQMAQQLLLKYNLDMSLIKDTDEVGDEVLTFKLKIYGRWKLFLWQSVAEVNFCNLILQNVDQNNKKVYIVGKPQNVEVVKEISDYLFKAVLRISKKPLKRIYNQIEINYPEESKWSNLKDRARQSFREGAVLGLSERLYALKEENKNNGLKSDDEMTSALVVRNAYEQSEKENNDFIDKAFGETKEKKARETKTNIEAFSYGISAQKDISLNTQIGG